MAFVFRSKRNLKLSEVEPSNDYPGKYYRENQLIKDLDKQSSEFQSRTTRNLPLKKLDTPGPGSYEKNIIYYDDLFSNFKKKKKIENIINTVKSNVIPKEVQKFISKNQEIAFNTRGGRFNYKIDELEKQKNIPGPGAYSPNTSMSLNNKKKISPYKEKNINNINNKNNNNLNKNDNNIYINANNNSSITNNISINNNRSQSTNDNSNISRLIKRTKSFNSKYRNETIPSKNTLGYEFDKNGDKKMIINNNELNNINSNNNDSVSPGQYNVQPNWEKNIISWDKMRNDDDEKYKIIKERKNLSPLTQLEKDYLLNSQRYRTNNIPKPKTEQNSKYNISKSKLFNFFLNSRYEKMKNINDKKVNKKSIFDGSPGPGYYSPEDIYSQSDINFGYNKFKKNFNAKTPRFKIIAKENNDLGPGFYYNRTKPKIIEKPKYCKGLIENPNKKDSLCALTLSLAKEAYKVPGPGSYELEGNLIHEDISNNENFGSNDRRFKNSIEIMNDYPGPGTYEKKGSFSQDKNNIKKKNIYTNYKTDLELIKELEKIPKEVFNTPPVGLYNPNIISSMEYNAKSKVNPYIDEKFVGFGSQEKKGMSFISKENNKNIGPGRYYKNKKLDMKQNNAPFNKSDKRFDYKQIDNNKMPGPGSYDINSFDDWNKKSHNILFV